MQKIEGLKYNHGGLMRCCLKTLFDAFDNHELEGDEIRCKYCGEKMRLDDGIWHWEAE